MSKLYPFKMVHLHLAEKITWTPEILVGLSENENSPSWSIVSCFSEKRLEGVYGIKRITHHTGECVAMPCGNMSAIPFHRGAIEVMKYWNENLKYKRIQATVKSGLKKNEDWLLRLGFKKEGVLIQYEPGVDHVLYGRVF